MPWIISNGKSYVEIIGNNQMITCEPGIYVPGVGGGRIEDLLVVKETGVVDLTNSEKIL